MHTTACGVNAAVLCTKQSMQLYSFWNRQNGSPGFLILKLLCYSNVCTLPSLSVRLFQVDVSLSEPSDQQVRFHTLGQTVC